MMGKILGLLIPPAYVALVMYAVVEILVSGESFSDVPTNWLWLLSAILVATGYIIFILYKMGKFKSLSDRKIEKSPELKKVMDHISANNTESVKIGKEGILVYNDNLSDNYYFSYKENNIKPPNKNDILTIASYIGRISFENRYSIKEDYDEDFVSGSGDLIGLRPNTSGGYTAIVDDGDTLRTFRGAHVYNKKFMKKEKPPKDTRNKLF